MNTKLERLKKIKNLIRSQSSPLTISEIHEALVKRLGLEVSRKTIERDIDDLIEARILIVLPGMPARFELIVQDEIELVLKVQEIKEIIEVMGIESEISQKLKKLLG
jgi:molybdopterin-biosynthesis enzyme MoeA-like protein